MPTSTWFGGIDGVPSALRTKPSTMMIRVKLVIMIRIDGARLSTVSRTSSWSEVETPLPPPLSRLRLMPGAAQAAAGHSTHARASTNGERDEDAPGRCGGGGSWAGAAAPPRCARGGSAAAPAAAGRADAQGRRHLRVVMRAQLARPARCRSTWSPRAPGRRRPGRPWAAAAGCGRRSRWWEARRRGPTQVVGAEPREGRDGVVGRADQEDLLADADDVQGAVGAEGGGGDDVDQAAGLAARSSAG